ncbi:MAG: ABC transporter ATP-binding protein [Pirellulaceae bacterium]|jgi:phospholipid/cholesterol/gamma-HCH transport system ATP-binding protein
MAREESEGSKELQSDSLVELKGVTLRFGSQTILDRIDLEIPRGQTLVVIGESGCGKTMLLKVMIRLIDPTLGEVYFDGKLLRSLGDVELTALRQRMGFVFQNAALFDSMTIGQNVAFPLRLKEGLDPAQTRRMVLDRLAEVGLPDNVYEKRPNQLSGGMRKRVGLARALMLEPDLVLYDEPTTGLDPIMSDVINELMMRTRAKRSVTSVIVTHDMHTARKVADRVVMLYPLSRVRSGESQILFDGPPDQLDQSSDRRVRQFVDGQAGDRLMEMRRAREVGDLETPNLLDQMQD